MPGRFLRNRRWSMPESHGILASVIVVASALILVGVLAPSLRTAGSAESTSLPGENAAVFYVATDGDDSGGDGSISNPWATITHALDNVSDGSTIWFVRALTMDGCVCGVRFPKA